ncbi:MAG TPA: ammonium transporter [Gemmatimonadaceae bacterium]
MSTISAGDTAWVMISTALVLLMVPGLALFYGGLVRSRAVLNTFMMSLLALAVVGVQWVVGGYSLAFGPGVRIGSLSWAGLTNIGAAVGPYSATIPHMAYVGFQAMFAGITVALISGAMVERIKFHVFAIFALVWTTLVYDPLAHWVWATDGWLHTLGALDFAGGTVVHISAGTAALVAAMMLGPRRDYGRVGLRPHNVVFTLTGAGLLWVGWLGFNAGSSLAADGVAAIALVNTHAAAASAMLAWLAMDYYRAGEATAVGGATGAVVGLVAITPAAGYVTPLAALAIGVIGAGASYVAMQIRSRTSIDDALDVFACHGVAGIAGALLTGVFATTAVNKAGANGLLYGSPHLLAIQALAVLCTILFAAPMTALIFGGIKVFGSLRVPLGKELLGIDVSEHGEHAYDEGDMSAATGRGVRINEPVVLTTGKPKVATEAA